MDGNTNWKPNEQDQDSLNANDWRSQHDPFLRKRVIAKVVDKLKEYFLQYCPDERQSEIYNSVTEFEERTYASAQNKDDYLRKLSEKSQMMERTYQINKHLCSSVNATNTPNPAYVVNQAQSLPASMPYTQNSRSQQLLPQNTQSNLNITVSSGLPTQVPIDISVAPTQNVNIEIGSRVQINLRPGTQTQMQGRQQLHPQQQQPQNSNYMFQNQVKQQLLKENILHENFRSPHMQQQSQPPPPQQQQHPQSLLKQYIQQSFPQSSRPLAGQQNSQFQPRHQFSTPLGHFNHQQHMAMPSHEPDNLEEDQTFSQLMNQDTQQRDNNKEKQGAARVSLSQQNNTASYKTMAQQSYNIQDTHREHLNSSALPSQHQQNIPSSSQSGNFNLTRSSFMGTQSQEIGQTQQTMVQQYQPQHHPLYHTQDRSLPQHSDPGKNYTQRFEGAISLCQTQNITDQQIQKCKFDREPLENPSTSQDTIGMKENVDDGNWQEETYQKIKALKEKYFLLLSSMHKTFRDKLQKNESLPQPENLEKLTLAKSVIAYIRVFLNVERNNITEKHRDMYNQFEGQILRFTKHHQTVQRPMQSQSHRMNSQLMPRTPNVASPLVSVPNSLQRSSMMEPRDDNNIIASAKNLQVQSNMLEKPKQTVFHHRHRQQQQERQANPQLQIPTIQQNYEMNDVKRKQGKAELLQEHLSWSPRQLIKPMGSSGRMSNLSPLPSSPQIADQQILSATVNNTGTPLQSGSSPFVSQSPRTSFALPVPCDLEKPISVESPVAQSHLKITNEQPPTVYLPSKPIAERPIDRLMKACRSLSQKNLEESVNEIRAVVNMVDRYAGSFNPSGLGEDLSAMSKVPFPIHEETNPSKRMKLDISALPRDITVQTDAYEQFNSLKLESGSIASSSSKVNKIETRFALLQEIKEINGRLIETVAEISDEATSGTIVTCSYSPVALSATFKAHYMSGKISQIQPLNILIPANYPNSSPILLEEISSDASVHIYEDLSARTKSRFGLSMKQLSNPASLKEIAQMWNDCARATMAEYAERHGGGTFSSKYGLWETFRSGDFAKR